MPHRLAVLAVFVACALTACAAPSDTNGMERKTAAEVQQAAVTALKSATSVHVLSKGTIDGQQAQIDMRIRGSSSSGTVELKGTSFQLVKIDDDVYLKGAAPTLTMLGVPAQAQGIAADRWLKLQAHEVTTLKGFSLEDIASQLANPDSPLEPSVEQTSLDNSKVVVISQQNGSKLHIANSGNPYPVRAVLQGDTPGQVDFSEYGADFDITAPQDPVVFSAPDDERRWLESIGAVRKDIDDTYRIVGTDWDESEVTLLGHTLGRCSRELIKPESPSVRVQPVHELVKQACQEYDKGAECFATAAKNWNQSGSPAANQVISDALDCGFAAQATGGKLLADAEIEGYKITPPR